jgi:hypothetical protein
MSIRTQYYIQCDRCFFVTRVFDDQDVLTKAAEAVGWIVTDDVVICPEDAKALFSGEDIEGSIDYDSSSLLNHSGPELYHLKYRKEK